MELKKQPGGIVWATDAPNWAADSRPHLTIAIAKQGIHGISSRGLRWALGQMYGVVGTGLIFAQHVFRGLKRDMYVRDDKDAAKKKLAVTWTAERDAELVGDAYNAELRFVPAPINRVFVVYISVNEMLTEFPDVYGWADHWAWLTAAPDLAGAPVEWDTRYDEKIWSREGVGKAR